MADGWVAGWAAGTVPGGDELADQTVRNVVFVSVGGSRVRVRVSNVHGARPVTIGRASVAVRQAGGAARGDVRVLTFDGRDSTVLPPGGRRFSDPVDLPVAALSTLLVSVYAPGPTGPVTVHPFTAQTNYLADGDAVADPSDRAFRPAPCWTLIDGVDVAPSAEVAGAVVAFGDSITDTANTTGDANRRWPDHLARRLAGRGGPTLSVVNAGMGGNCLLTAREGEPWYGEPGLARLARDAFEQTGARVVVLAEGVNDIGFDASAGDLIDGYRRAVGAARSCGLRMVGATVTPFLGAESWTPRRGEVWRAVNSWIRESGTFDAVIDFAAAVAAPDDPRVLRADCDSGDRLHPNDTGTRVMADAVDLEALLGPLHAAVTG